MVNRSRQRVEERKGYDFYFLKKGADDLIENYVKKKKKSIYFEKYGIPIIIFILVLILILKYILFVI
jgi:hypothetical protein